MRARTRTSAVFVLFLFTWVSAAFASTPMDLLSGWSPPGGEQAVGAMAHQVHLDLPPAPGNMVPDLRLSTSHLSGNGPLGRGWTLGGLSRIDRRSALGGVPTWGSTDVYMVDGVQLHDDPIALMPGCELRLEQDDNRCFAQQLTGKIRSPDRIRSVGTMLWRPQG